MTGTRCTVATCKNSLEKSKKEGKDIKYHRFPKDVVTAKIWAQKCRRDGQWNIRSCHICSEHFTDEDYERDLKGEMLGSPLKRKLKSTAVPTKQLPSLPQCSITNPRYERAERRRNKQIVEELLNDANSVVDSIDVDKQVSQSTTENVSHNNKEAQYEDLLSKCNQLLQEKSEMQKLLSVKEQLLTEALNNIKLLEKRLLKTNNALEGEQSFRLNIEKALNGFLSKSQLDLVLGKKKKIVWRSDDISKAFAIRYFSKRCYTYLRETLKYPLPGISSLQRWASRLDLRQGLLMNVLKFLEIGGNNLTEFEKVCIIQFDEVKVNSVYEYDRKADEVLGPHSQMQVVLIRGLFSSWKQPIYLGFDQKMTQEILLDIIRKLNDISYSVVGCVSDCGGGNIGLWKELGITKDSNFFKHPVTNENIYYFPDVPHLLKLTRNWLVDTGFVLSDGKNPGITQKNLNTLAQGEQDEYIVAKVILKCGVSVDSEADNMLDDTSGSEDILSSPSDVLGSHNSVNSQSEADGFNYLAGWIARKYKNKYPEMGNYSYAVKTGDHDYVIPQWVQHLSHGGLTVPSEKWSSEIKFFCKAVIYRLRYREDPIYFKMPNGKEYTGHFLTVLADCRGDIICLTQTWRMEI
ncbi:hypothetical protein PPYR_01455 [Photinus pyralis]|uniref:THAP-type domain-containing protein n=1 Tax=Photinus pyralis TaxID=7054 RepID=A0A5N4B4G3_PHOPY|nr:hypothetical protein PPYR_01455 [Photinus pyralis]